jgi:5-methylcytosine-specific restriction endonuclease McrA
MDNALLTNAAYQVVSRVPWQRAVTLVVTGAVDVVEEHPHQVIHSAGGLAIPLPTIVRQRIYVHAPRAHGPRGDNATRAGIMRRDKWTCGYCGDRASTIDHVFPRSRGGLDRWDNLIAACERCNQAKGDHTPVEWGVPLLWMPYAPNEHAAEQDRVWLALASTG